MSITFYVSSLLSSLSYLSGEVRAVGKVIKKDQRFDFLPPNFLSHLFSLSQWSCLVLFLLVY